MQCSVAAPIDNAISTPVVPTGTVGYDRYWSSGKEDTKEMKMNLRFQCQRRRWLLRAKPAKAALTKHLRIKKTKRGPVHRVALVSL